MSQQQQLLLGLDIGWYTKVMARLHVNAFRVDTVVLPAFGGATGGYHKTGPPPSLDHAAGMISCPQWLFHGGRAGVCVTRGASTLQFGATTL